MARRITRRAQTHLPGLLYTLPQKSKLRKVGLMNLPARLAGQENSMEAENFLRKDKFYKGEVDYAVSMR